MDTKQSSELHYQIEHGDSHQPIDPGATRAAQVERNMTFWQAVSTYPKAVLWSIVISLPVIMEGYDTALLGSFYAYPSFVQKYGTRLPDGTYNLSAAWQSGLTNGALVGEILGLFLNGWACEKYGYKRVTQVSLGFLSAFIFIPFFAPTVEVLVVGEILCGIPWGVFQTLTIAYAADVCPTVLRAHLTSYVTLCWIMGTLIAVGVLRGLLGRTDEWSYRIPFALQWIWPVPIFCAVLFAPESPYWLIRHGRLHEAARSLSRLMSTSDSSSLEDALALMVYTDKIESENQSGTSYKDCFKGTNLRRTEIVCVLGGLVQVLCGQALAGLGTYFFVQAGVPTEYSFDLGMGQNAVLLLGFLIGWINLRFFGRRTLTLVGLVFFDIVLLIIGCLSLAPTTDTRASWASGILLMLWSFVAGATFYPTVFPIQGEIPSSRLRAKTIVLQRNLYNIVGLVFGILNLYMLNPTAWNLHGKTAFVYTGTCFWCIIYCYFRLPEAKGLTYADLDLLFERKTPARKFKQTGALLQQESSVVSRVENGDGLKQ